MPFTPFHFGPNACIALAANKYIDIIAFIFASVMIDIEPLLVIIFNLNYPLHGLAHSFLGATLIGLLWGFIVFRYRNVSAHFMKKIKFPYVTNLGKAILSGILGGWFHVLLDAPIYADIRPFYPVSRNPFYGLLDDPKMYLFCAICFIPAFALYVIIKIKNSAHNKPVQRT